MYYKITNTTDVKCLKNCIENKMDSIDTDDYYTFIDVALAVENNINTLSKYYGDNRDSESNLGGYLLLFNTTDEQELINVIYERYGINDEYVEFEDVLAENEKVRWISKLFVVSADYNVVIVMPIAKNGIKNYRLEL